MPEPQQPSNAPSEDEVRSVPLDLDEGEDRVIEQENVGRENMAGGGEWPSPSTPPRGPAPGTVAENDPGEG
jgi:hypothetical protein